jgi:hypothetical protein
MTKSIVLNFELVAGFDAAPTVCGFTGTTGETDGTLIINPDIKYFYIIISFNRFKIYENIFKQIKRLTKSKNRCKDRIIDRFRRFIGYDL